MPDFPSPGILFKDLTPVLADAAALALLVDELTARLRTHEVDKVAGIEARGFVLAAPVALRLGAGFVPIRKPGKLPAATVREDYALEYGTDALEVHRDAVAPGERVAIVDDVIATGGTAAAAARLVERIGGEVTGLAFAVELGFLDGAEQLAGRRHFSLVTY